MENEAKEDHLEVIARECSFDWMALRPHLGLSSAQEQDINRSESQYGEQRRVCLYKWKEVKGTSATYRALVEAANRISNRMLADKVKEVMNTPSIATTNNSKTTSINNTNQKPKGKV